MGRWGFYDVFDFEDRGFLGVLMVWGKYGYIVERSECLACLYKWVGNSEWKWDRVAGYCVSTALPVYHLDDLNHI